MATPKHKFAVGANGLVCCEQCGELKSALDLKKVDGKFTPCLESPDFQGIIINSHSK